MMALAKVFGLLLMVVCFVALADAGAPKKDDDDEIDTKKTGKEDDSPEEDEISLQELITMIADLLGPQTVTAAADFGKWCSCTGLTCKCCLKVDTKLFKTKSCTVLEYIPANKSASIALKFKDTTVYQKTFLVSDPPKLCLGYKAVKVCLEFYGIKTETKTFTVCVRDSLYVISKKIISDDIGCFTSDIPPPRASLPKTTSKPKG